MFLVDYDYYFAQCISADFAMGAGIALQFNRYFNMKEKLMDKYYSWIDRWDQFPEERGTCILEGRVYNLITKRNYWNKPTIDTMRSALKSMKVCVQNNPEVKKIAMPKIGCGMDKLDWSAVRAAIQEIFADVNVEILVCYQ